MKKILIITMILLVAGMHLAGAVAVPSFDGSIDWEDGQGLTSAVELCGDEWAPSTDNYLHWILPQAGNISYAEINVNGDGWVPMTRMTGPTIHFYTTPYYDLEDELKYMDVEVRYVLREDATCVDSGAKITLSHYCPGGGITEVPEFPTIALPIAAIIGLAFIMQRRKE